MPLSSSSSMTHRCSVRSASSAKLVSVIFAWGNRQRNYLGEAQRIELQRAQNKATLYVLGEPTTGLHPFDVENLMRQLDGLVASGNTVVVVEHDMDVVARSDWVIDI
jgi:excinuclease UvrABC ATPase subunit